MWVLAAVNLWPPSTRQTLSTLALHQNPNSQFFTKNEKVLFKNRNDSNSYLSTVFLLIYLRPMILIKLIVCVWFKSIIVTQTRLRAKKSSESTRSLNNRSSLLRRTPFSRTCNNRLYLASIVAFVSINGLFSSTASWQLKALQKTFDFHSKTRVNIYFHEKAIDKEPRFETG